MLNSLKGNPLIYNNEREFTFKNFIISKKNIIEHILTEFDDTESELFANNDDVVLIRTVELDVESLLLVNLLSSRDSLSKEFFAFFFSHFQ